MLSTDVLVLIAELAIAIAGFSSVVVALDNRAVRNWDPFQRHNLRVLLQVSALTIFFALFPLILQRAFNGESFWNWALGVYAVVHLVDVTSFLGRLPKDMPRANRLLLSPELYPIAADGLNPSRPRLSSACIWLSEDAPHSLSSALTSAPSRPASAQSMAAGRSRKRAPRASPSSGNCCSSSMPMPE